MLVHTDPSHTQLELSLIHGGVCDIQTLFFTPSESSYQKQTTSTGVMTTGSSTGSLSVGDSGSTNSNSSESGDPASKPSPAIRSTNPAPPSPSGSVSQINISNPTTPAPTPGMSGQPPSIMSQPSWKSSSQAVPSSTSAEQHTITGDKVHHTNMVAIVVGTAGALSLCVLLSCMILLWFRRAARRRKTAPSAEFMSEGVVCSNVPEFSSQWHGSLATHDALYEPYPEDPPPPFSPGLYTDRILEKMQEQGGQKQTLKDEEGSLYGSASRSENGSIAEDHNVTYPRSFLEHHVGIGEAI